MIFGEAGPIYAVGVGVIGIILAWLVGKTDNFGNFMLTGLTPFFIFTILFWGMDVPEAEANTKFICNTAGLLPDYQKDNYCFNLEKCTVSCEKISNSTIEQIKVVYRNGQAYIIKESE